MQQGLRRKAGRFQNVAIALATAAHSHDTRWQLFQGWKAAPFQNVVLAFAPRSRFKMSKQLEGFVRLQSQGRRVLARLGIVRMQQS
eukprot:5782868-Pyramimonas_sp.AAC.1